MSGTTARHAGDHTEPTFDEVADLADELGYRLHHNLVLLEMIRDDEVRNQCHVAAAVMAPIEQADQTRERLMEQLDRLAESERTTRAVKGPKTNRDRHQTSPSGGGLSQEAKMKLIDTGGLPNDQTGAGVMAPVLYHNGRFPPPTLDWPALIPLVGPVAAAVARYDGMLSAIPNPARTAVTADHTGSGAFLAHRRHTGHDG